MTPLAQSYEYCRRVARARARNFYYSFLLLPKPRRDAMCAIYAFMRTCDDLSDDPALAGREPLAEWRSELERALAGEPGTHPCWPAFADTVRRYSIPHEYFRDMLDGVSGDLDAREFATFADLRQYCYRVASVVGLVTVHIFGFDSPRALELAETCGVAFQLTNILRDVKEDAGRGRLYLPREDLERFGLTRETLCSALPQFRALMQFEVARTRKLYEQSRPLIGMVSPATRPALWALIEIYRRLLDRIERSNYDVLTRRVRLPAWEKAWIVVRASLSAGGMR
ncbi:MAG: phytoene/squalene synthase family protein [Acidobacteria bacterium]|nr:phytoene/squalene synthase family protein [Acidobacteriota bacterium]MBI3280234.1 phytoene/squalene synthase family protein [Acidobacteriota bacterium]